MLRKGEAMAAKKILIIDDNEDFSKLLGFDLKSKGYDIVIANDGEDGFKKVRTEKPHLILLDIKMPELDGFTFVRMLKSDEAIKKIPVLILTGHEPMRDLFKLEGVAGYFVKGDDTSALMKSIEVILLATEAP